MLPLGGVWKGSLNQRGHLGDPFHYSLFFSLSCSPSVDNSEYMRNGDFLPTRLQAQQDAVNIVCHSKTRSNPENNVGLITLAKYVGRRGRGLRRWLEVLPPERAGAGGLSLQEVLAFWAAHKAAFAHSPQGETSQESTANTICMYLKMYLFEEQSDRVSKDRFFF